MSNKIISKRSTFFCLILTVTLNLTLCLLNIAQAEENVFAARIWPAQEYTRITLESNSTFLYKMSIIENPDRIVLDIENVALDPVIKSLSDKILSNDPYIKQIRAAKFKQGAIRLVVDLKTKVKPKAFTLPPTGTYQHRLVLDIYPIQDPIMAMIAERERLAANSPINASKQKPKKPPSIVANSKPDVNLKNENISNSVESASSAESAGIAVESLPPLTLEPDEIAVNDAGTLNTSVKPTQIIQPNETVMPAENASATETEKNIELTEQEGNQATKKKIINPFNKNLYPKDNDRRQITVVIDAGHGGEDPGARGASGSREKDVTLMIAKRLKNKIDNEPGMRAELTRDSDYFIPLHGRVIKARKLQADLFVSIHADAFTNPAARGSSVFALSDRGATSAGARYLAKKENESDLIGGVSLNDKDPVLARTLLDLSQTATINDSLKLGKAVLGQISMINVLHANRVEQAAFAVLKSPDIPSILVETAFISNPEEERRLNDEAYQDKLVTSILVGIKKYFSTNPALAKTKIARE